MGNELKTITGAIRDQNRQEIYDTVVIAATVSPIAERAFFTDVQNKARYLTNLRINQTLEGKTSYQIQGLRIDAHNMLGGNADMLALIEEHSYLKLRVGERDYWNGPMGFLTGGISVHNAMDNSAAPIDRHFSQYGMPRMAGVVFTKNDVIEIAPLKTFAVDWSCQGMDAAEIVRATPVATNKLAVRMIFQGLLRRPL